MEPEIKMSISDTGARRHLFEVLPMLRTMPDTEAVDALEELYRMGAESGAEQATKAMQEMGSWLAWLVAAHQSMDAAGVVAILDEFIAARCVIKGGPAPTTSH